MVPIDDLFWFGCILEFLVLLIELPDRNSAILRASNDQGSFLILEASYTRNEFLFEKS
jgi:hypothetical protein